MDNFWLIAAVVFGIPLIFGGIVRLCITINDVRHAVKLENDPLMVTFLQRMEQGMIRTFYINDSMICYNFSVKKNTKTTTTETYRGEVLINRSVREDVSYIAELIGMNVVDFESIGHQVLSNSHLRQYRNQLIAKLQQCPQIARVDFYENTTFEPANLFVRNKKHGAKQSGCETFWVIEYQYSANAVPPALAGKKIG